MGKMIINGKECEFTNERNVLEVIRKNGFNVPTFCYRPDLKKDFGACRMCVVEIVGARALQAACVYPVNEGLEVYTNSAKVRKARKAMRKIDNKLTAVKFISLALVPVGLTKCKNPVCHAGN